MVHVRRTFVFNFILHSGITATIGCVATTATQATPLAPLAPLAPVAPLAPMVRGISSREVFENSRRRSTVAAGCFQEPALQQPL
jgi:hypothetical protein